MASTVKSGCCARNAVSAVAIVASLRCDASTKRSAWSSVSGSFSQKVWKEQENYNFRLLSDFNREAVAAYGAQYDSLLGFQGVAKRAAFVVDKAGKVQYAEVLDDARNLPNFDKINETLQGLN